MNISSIEITRVSIPFETGWDGPRRWTRMESLLVRVGTDQGLSGWGEAFGHTANAGTYSMLTDVIGPWFLGRDYGSIPALMDEAARAFHVIGRTGPAAYALSGIDIALWDIAAQNARQPLFRLLGGKSGQALSCYASLMPYGDPVAAATNARRAQDCGYAGIKLHETTLPVFAAVREAVDRALPIMLDVNCPWTVDEACAIARAIRDGGFEWLEEPIWPPEDFASLAAVQAEGVTTAAGENVGPLHDFIRLLQSGAVGVVQPSVAKVGGITAMRRILDAAEAFPVRVVPHCFYWGPGYLATAHIAASMPHAPLIETAFIDLERSPHPMFNPRQGRITLAEEPGLGFHPDQDVLDAYTVARSRIG